MKGWGIAMIALFSLLLLGQIAYRFLDREVAPIVDPDLINVFSPLGEKVSLGQLLADDLENRIFLMSLNDCEPCLAKGLARLTSTDPTNAQPFVLVVNDWQEEVEGFSYHYPDLPFYRIASDHIADIGSITRLPVYLEYESGRWSHIEIIELEMQTP